MKSIPLISTDKAVKLVGKDGLPESVHEFDEQTAWTVRAAYAAQRPLLVRGEPGTGKSQLARAVAAAWNFAFISEAVHARSESQDLLWRFDAVARLGDAQALSAGNLGADQVKERLAPLKYLSPGQLWWVFDWGSALAQHIDAGASQFRPLPTPDNWQPGDGAVLLIDEIDKAEAELPNGLLDTLGNGSFNVPWMGRRIGMKEGATPPLVIITTNEERDMPAAFLRRCMVLNLSLPLNESDFLAWLTRRGRLHFGEQCTEKVYSKAAEQLWKDRQDMIELGMSPPGQAEYIDLLRALIALHKGGTMSQEDILDKIGCYALKKHSAET